MSGEHTAQVNQTIKRGYRIPHIDEPELSEPVHTGTLINEWGSRIPIFYDPKEDIEARRRAHVADLKARRWNGVDPR